MGKLCPSCGKVGNGPYTKTVASKGNKYRYASYFAHPYKREGGKWRVKWCYVLDLRDAAAKATRVEAVREAFNEMIRERLLTSSSASIWGHVYDYGRSARGRRRQAWRWYRSAIQRAVRDLGVSGRTIRRHLYRPLTQEMRVRVLLAIAAIVEPTETRIMEFCDLNETEVLMVLWRDIDYFRVGWNHNGADRILVSLSKQGAREAAYRAGRIGDRR